MNVKASWPGLLEITLFIFDCFVILSWAIENNLVYLRFILAGLWLQKFPGLLTMT